MLLPSLMMISALPEILLAGLLCAILVASVYIKEASRYFFAQRAVLMALVITMATLMLGMNNEGLAFNDVFITDSFATIFKMMVILAAFFVLYMGDETIRLAGFNHFEYPILAGFAVLGMMMMLSAHDLMSLYIGLELQSLSLYVLASFHRDSLRATEAGLKYFVLGALASGLLLYGSSLIYGFIGATEFSAIAAALGELAHSENTQGTIIYPAGIIIGLVFILAAMAFKISATPFHMWAPDVYEGVPTPVTAFFASAPKIAAVGLLIRIVIEPFGDMFHQWQQIIIVLSALSMMLGAFAGLVQQNIKRLLAYSSIGHVGFALMGLAAGGDQGITAVGVYLGIYLATTLGTFGCVLAMRRQKQAVEQIDDLAGFGKSHPMIALALMLFMFSMAGIPPLAGFFAKWYVFSAAINSGLLPLTIVGAVSSVVSAFYYLRIIKVMYFDSTEIKLDTLNSSPVKLVIAISAAIVMGFVFYPALITAPAELATKGLF